VRVAATVAADATGVSVLRPIAGVPMLVRAVRAVLDAGVAPRVTIDVPEPDAAVLRACAGLPVDLARGNGTHGDQRLTSGDDAITVQVVLRHDARRPLTPSALVVAVVDAVVAGHAAAVPVLPLTDTVKIVDGAGVVRGGPDRGGMRVVQAPRAWRPGAEAGETHAVPGDHLALRIRTEWDLRMAETLA
jgi:2-C-methyl-D-erythritol 4-phosphate cytidylyltransferase